MQKTATAIVWKASFKDWLVPPVLFPLVLATMIVVTALMRALG